VPQVLSFAWPAATTDGWHTNAASALLCCHGQGAPARLGGTGRRDAVRPGCRPGLDGGLAWWPSVVRLSVTTV